MDLQLHVANIVGTFVKGYAHDNIVELYYDGDEERNLIGSYYIDSDKIKTPLDLLDAFNKSGRTPEMVTELLNDALTDCSRFTFD